MSLESALIFCVAWVRHSSLKCFLLSSPLIRYAYGKVYLGAWLEAVSKRLIGSSVAKSPDSGLVVGVCRQALSVFEKDGH